MESRRGHHFLTVANPIVRPGHPIPAVSYPMAHRDLVAKFRLSNSRDSLAPAETMHNAKGLAVKIHHKLGAQIHQACRRSIVSEGFLAGLIPEENAQPDPNAFRFEKGVFAKLKAFAET